jgi:hypothetical protein
LILGLSDPESNQIIKDLNLRLQNAVKKKTEIAAQANEKLKAAYAVRNDLKKQLSDLKEVFEPNLGEKGIASEDYGKRK